MSFDHSDGIDPWIVTWSLGVTGLQSVRDYAEEVTYTAGETIFSRGDVSDAMYLVLEGTVLILVQDTSGAEQTASIVSSGQSFGEVGLLGNIVEQVYHPPRSLHDLLTYRGRVRAVASPSEQNHP